MASATGISYRICQNLEGDCGYKGGHRKGSSSSPLLKPLSTQLSQNEQTQNLQVVEISSSNAPLNLSPWDTQESQPLRHADLPFLHHCDSITLDQSKCVLIVRKSNGRWVRRVHSPKRPCKRGTFYLILAAASHAGILVLSWSYAVHTLVLLDSLAFVW